MSAENRAFLERVMTDGVIDPGKRMRELLSQLTQSLKVLMTSNQEEIGHPENSSSATILDADGMVDALDELRDTVEQIDYARDFVKMNGLLFLFGCASERGGVPVNVRKECLKVLSTLSQNNPPVQQAMLDMDALSKLCGLYMDEAPTDENGNFRTVAVQAMSCMIRSYQVAEDAFCCSDTCRAVVNDALGVGQSVTQVPINLRTKMLFLLRALLTSDYSSRQRVRDFEAAIRCTVEFLDYNAEDDLELREASLGLLLQILEQKNSVDGVMSERSRIMSLAVPRVAALRALPAEQKETHEQELELWEALVVELAKGLTDRAIDVQRTASNEVAGPTLMLEGRPPDDPGTTLAQ